MKWQEVGSWIKAVNSDGQLVFARFLKNEHGVFPMGETWYYFNLRDGALSNTGWTPEAPEELWRLAAEHFGIELEGKSTGQRPLPAERADPWTPPNVFRRRQRPR